MQANLYFLGKHKEALVWEEVYPVLGFGSSPFPFEMESVHFMDKIFLKNIKGKKCDSL